MPGRRSADLALVRLHPPTVATTRLGPTPRGAAGAPAGPGRVPGDRTEGCHAGDEGDHKGASMQGLMQEEPLTLVHFFRRAEELFPGKTITTATAGGRRRTSY